MRPQHTDLALLDFIPTLYKVLHYIEHDRSRDRHVHIVPRHASTLDCTQTIAHVVRDVLEVHNTRVVVILAWEERRERVGRVHISEWMVVGVPTAKAEVQSADACIVVVDHHHLLVVRPEFDVIYTSHESLRASSSLYKWYLCFLCDRGAACTRCSGEAPSTLR